MPLLGIIIVLLVVGVVMAMAPIDPKIRQVIYIVLVVALLLWLLAAVGLFGTPYWRVW